MTQKPVINYNKCVGNLDCIDCCHQEVFEEEDSKAKVVNPEDCVDGCDDCVHVCEERAIELDD